MFLFGLFFSKSLYVTYVWFAYNREQIPKRSSSRTIQAIGVYPGAKVTRGPDWSAKYKDQDGKTIVSRPENIEHF